MDRKYLESLGIESEAIDKIMESHGKVVNPLKQHKESLETEVESYKEQIADRDTQLEELQGKVGTEDDLKATIESLKTANKEKDDQHNARMKQQKLDYEVKIALNESGARNERAVKALLDLDTVKINEEGQLIGLDEQLNTLKTSDDYLFNTESNASDPEPTDPKPSGYSPNNKQTGNGGKEVTDEDYARQKLKELYPTKEEN